MSGDMRKTTKTKRTRCAANDGALGACRRLALGDGGEFHSFCAHHASAFLVERKEVQERRRFLAIQSEAVKLIEQS